MNRNNEMISLMLIVGKETNTKTFTFIMTHLPNQTKMDIQIDLLPIVTIHIQSRNIINDSSQNNS